MLECSFIFEGESSFTNVDVKPFILSTYKEGVIVRLLHFEREGLQQGVGGSKVPPRKSYFLVSQETKYSDG